MASAAAIRRPLAPSPAAPGAAAVPVGAATHEQLRADGGTSVPRPAVRSAGSMEQKGHINEKKEDISQRISAKLDKLSDGFAEHSRLLKQLEAQIKENNKHSGAIDLTPWAVSIPASFLLVALYNYVQG